LRPKVFFKDAPAPEQIAVRVAIMLQRWLTGVSAGRFFALSADDPAPFCFPEITADTGD
jgi:hypothetical protein